MLAPGFFALTADSGLEAADLLIEFGLTGPARGCFVFECPIGIAVRLVAMRCVGFDTNLMSLGESSDSRDGELLPDESR